MTITNKNAAAEYYTFMRVTRDEMIMRCNKCKAHINEVLHSIRKLGGQFAIDATIISLHMDGFIVKIDGHHGDIAWHDGTYYMYETYGTVADGDDVTRHETVDDAVTALMRTPA